MEPEAPPAPPEGSYDAWLAERLQALTAEQKLAAPALRLRLIRDLREAHALPAPEAISGVDTYLAGQGCALPVRSPWWIAPMLLPTALFAAYYLTHIRSTPQSIVIAGLLILIFLQAFWVAILDAGKKDILRAWTASLTRPKQRRAALRAVLGSVDWEAVRTLAGREAALLYRGRSGARVLAWTAALAGLLAWILVLDPAVEGTRLRPRAPLVWIEGWTLLVGIGICGTVLNWVSRRVARELRAGMLDDLMLTRCGVAEVVLGKAVGMAGLPFLLAGACLPSMVLVAAAAGQPPSAAPKLFLTITLCGLVALCWGLEGSFDPKIAGTFGVQLYSLFLLFRVAPLLNAGLARVWPQAAAVAAGIGNAVLSYNPASAALAAMGRFPQRWPLGLMATAAFLLWSGWRGLRKIPLQWERLPETPPPHGPAGKVTTEREAMRGAIASASGAAMWARREWAPDRFWTQDRWLHDETAALRWWEGKMGVRLLLGAPWWVGVLFTGVLALIPVPRMGRLAFAVALSAACLTAALHACATVATERHQGRWPDLALLPARERELLHAKLRPLWRMAWLPMTVGAVAVLSARVWAPHSSAGWGAWAAVALFALPPASAVLGLWIGAVTPDTGEAQWRTGVWFGGVPLLLSVGLALGLRLDFAILLCPQTAAVEAIRSGSLSSFAWAGLLLYVGLAAIAWRGLERNLRPWVLAP